MGFPSIDPEEVGATGLLWLLVSYGYVLYMASNQISEGSDLLMLIPSLQDLVGSVVLPLLGAVPDGAIMFFSGIGDIAEAQETLSVGVGALAGSTIMLLTIPWFLAIFGGRVRLDESGNALYNAKPKLKKHPTIAESLIKTGVSVDDSVKKTAKIMLVTTIPYFLIQIPASYYSGRVDDLALAEHSFALIGFLICIMGFLMYIYFQLKSALTNQSKLRKIAIMSKMLDEGKVSLEASVYKPPSTHAPPRKGSAPDDTTPLVTGSLTRTKSETGFVSEYLRQILYTKFKNFDKNHDKVLDLDEVILMLGSFNMKLTREEAKSVFDLMDEDKDGTLSFNEIVKCASIFVMDQYGASKQDSGDDDDELFIDDEEEDEEEDEIPAGISSLPPEEQHAAIKKLAFMNLASGAVLILIFSDPMVDLLQELARRLNIPPFYVSFALAPLAANASEVLASFYFARKKTSKSIIVSLSNLIGAASMNNTFCLAILLGLIYFRGLAWQYTAETLAIVLVQFVACYLTTKKTMTLLHGFVMLSLFPLSIAVVWLLEEVFGLN